MVEKKVDEHAAYGICYVKGSLPLPGDMSVCIYIYVINQVYYAVFKHGQGGPGIRRIGCFSWLKDGQQLLFIYIWRLHNLHTYIHTLCFVMMSPRGDLELRLFYFINLVPVYLEKL